MVEARVRAMLARLGGQGEPALDRPEGIGGPARRTLTVREGQEARRRPTPVPGAGGQCVALCDLGQSVGTLTGVDPCKAVGLAASPAVEREALGVAEGDHLRSALSLRPPVAPQPVHPALKEQGARQGQGFAEPAGQRHTLTGTAEGAVGMTQVPEKRGDAGRWSIAPLSPPPLRLRRFTSAGRRPRPRPRRSRSPIPAGRRGGSMSSMLISPGRPDSDRNTLRMPSTSNRASENFLKPSWSRQMRRAASMSLTNTPMWLMRFSMILPYRPRPARVNAGAITSRGTETRRRAPRESSAVSVSPRWSRLDDVRLCALYERDDLVALGLRNPKGVERGVQVSPERRPIALVDLHSAVERLHVPSGVVERPARAGAQEIDQELRLPPHSVVSAVLPEAGESGIGFQARDQVAGDCGDGVIAPEPFIECAARH